MRHCFKILLILGAVAGCAGNRKTISERPLVEATMSDEATVASTREISPPPVGKEFYVKSKELKVKPVRKENMTGSLSSVGDARSYVLPTTLPVAVGTVLDIKTSSNRLDTPATPAPGQAAAAPGGDKSAQLEQTLMSALPNLEPGTKDDKPTLVKSFKAQVIDIRENGDVVVAYHRRSIRADQAADLLIKAVVPYNALTDRDNITTAQVQDVQLNESQDGEMIERISSNWEDEYTLRISGFDEAKSKSALALEDNRRQVQSAKDKVVAQIKSLGLERQSMTKERQELLDKKAKDDARMEELEAKLKEREEEIDKLKPKEEEEESSDNSDEEADKESKDPKSKTKLVDAKSAAKGAPAKTPPAKTPPAKTPPAKTPPAKPAAKADKAVAKEDTKKPTEGAKK